MRQSTFLVLNSVYVAKVLAKNTSSKTTKQVLGLLIENAAHKVRPIQASLTIIELIVHLRPEAASYKGNKERRPPIMAYNRYRILITLANKPRTTYIR